MIEYIDKLSNDLSKDNLQKYWPTFQSVAYALYTNEYVYLFNHPMMEAGEESTYKIIPWNEAFTGNTLILYEEHPTAILYLGNEDKYEDVYSVLVHELFHGFQYEKGEKRFPDEVLGVTYPLTKENIGLRYQERMALYQAVTACDPNTRLQNVKAFIALREKRRANYREPIQYESCLETVEGPAFYVELKAFAEKSTMDKQAILNKYGETLNQVYESTANIRKSCYSSGLFICLLLDDYDSDWKDRFWDHEKTVFDQLKACFTDEQAEQSLQKNVEVENAIESINRSKKEVIEAYEQRKGHHLIIEGNIKVESFDPMNITAFENKLLHENFLKIKVNNASYLLREPVITYYQDEIHRITKLLVSLKKPPIEKKNALLLADIGELEGKYEKKGTTYHVLVSS